MAVGVLWEDKGANGDNSSGHSWRGFLKRRWRQYEASEFGFSRNRELGSRRRQEDREGGKEYQMNPFLPWKQLLVFLLFVFLAFTSILVVHSFTSLKVYIFVSFGFYIVLWFHILPRCLGIVWNLFRSAQCFRIRIQLWICKSSLETWAQRQRVFWKPYVTLLWHYKNSRFWKKEVYNIQCSELCESILRKSLRQYVCVRGLSDPIVLVEFRKQMCGLMHKKIREITLLVEFRKQMCG